MSNINEYTCEFLLTNPTFFDELKTEDQCRICRHVLVKAHCAPCGCEFCYSCIRKHLENGPKQCPGGESECSMIRLEFDKDIRSNPATNRRILRKEVICSNDGCCVALNVERMIEHLRFCNMRNLQCPLSYQGCSRDEMTFNDIKTHLSNELPQHFQYLLDLIISIKDENKELRQRLQNLEQTCSADIESFEIDGMNPNENDDEIPIEEDDIWRELKRSKKMLWSEIKNLNQFIWIVDDFMSIPKDANPKNFCLTSPGFYTHPGGYKLQLLLYPTGYDGQSGYSSLYFQLIQGKYDDLLVWPCSRNIFLSTVDQTNGQECLIKLFNSNQVKDNDSTNIYQRPGTIKKNLMGGCQKYINFADETNSVLMKSNKIIIKCKSSPNNN